MNQTCQVESEKTKKKHFDGFPVCGYRKLIDSCVATQIPLTPFMADWKGRPLMNVTDELSTVIPGTLINNTDVRSIELTDTMMSN